MVTDSRLAVGDTAPLFRLDDQDGTSVSLADLRGHKVILYFYPAALTPACTEQTCDFRDSLASLGAHGYRVLGISKDDVATLKKFEEAEHVTFPLLSDEDLTVHRAYATWGEKNLYGKITVGTLRSTFVIDENGVITHTFYNTKAKNHVAMLRKKLGLIEA